MTTLRASFVPSSLQNAVIQGQVRPTTVDFTFDYEGPPVTSAIIDANSRRMVALDLDVAEMSFGTYTRARDLNLPLRALPIFPGRRSLQPAIAVMPGADIVSPAELAGKRVAIGQFWQTAFVWHRLLLNTAYGVSQDQISWVTTAAERWDALPPPAPDTRLDASGRDALALLKAGEVDAAFTANGSALADLTDPAGPRRLFPDAVQAQRDYFASSGIFPIIHLVVLREELATDRELVADLCATFQESKRRGLANMIQSPAETPILGGDPSDVPALFGADPWPYGIAPNRRVLDTYLEDVFSHQHLTDRRLQVEELFAPELPPDLR